MVLRSISPLGSVQFHEMTDYTIPLEPFRSTSQLVEDHQPQASFGENNSAGLPERYAQTAASTVADLAFSPWLLDLPPHASPLWRTSSTSGSEHVATPPPYMEHTPMYHVVDEPNSQSSSYMMRDSSYVQNQELTWQPHLSGGCTSQPPSLHLGHPMWRGSSYGGPSMPPMDYYAHQYTGSPGPSYSQPSSDNSTVRYDETGLRPSIVPSTTGSDSDNAESEYDNDDSSYSQRRDTTSRSASHHKDSHATPVLKLGRWSTIIDPYNHPPARNYACNRVELSGPHERHCEQSFQRPEHLRRHIKTVHGQHRPFICKVPSCGRAFSRGDNLRDHYWTHLHRGGRAGKNDKMTLAELKAILGKDKRLVRRLKQRLTNTQAKLRIRSKL